MDILAYNNATTLNPSTIGAGASDDVHPGSDICKSIRCDTTRQPVPGSTCALCFPNGWGATAAQNQAQQDTLFEEDNTKEFPMLTVLVVGAGIIVGGAILYNVFKAKPAL